MQEGQSIATGETLNEICCGVRCGDAQSGVMRARLCYRVMPQSHATRSCHKVMPQNHATRSCHRIMPQGHATRPCHRVMSPGHATGSCHSHMKYAEISECLKSYEEHGFATHKVLKINYV